MWLTFALLARLFWAGTNAVDQLLARVHPKHSASAALIVLYICYLPFSVLACLLTPHFRFQSHVLIYSAGAVLGASFAMIPYFKALQREQAYNVTPYMELTPIFLIGFAYLLNGETLTPIQFIGATLVILSGFLFSWDFANSRFKAAIFALLASASFLFAIYQYCVSQAELNADIWGVVACYYFGLGMVGLVLFLALKDVRKTIVQTFAKTKAKPVYLALGSNTLDFAAFACVLMAFRLAPTIGHVAALSGSQPIFSFLLALPLAKFFPQHYSKIAFNREICAKMVLIIFIFCGVYLLSTR